MLTITIPAFECYDEENERFINFSDTVLILEHSLLSLAAWESKWHKPFIGNNNKTIEESLDYIKCMTLNRDMVPELAWTRITDDMMQQVIDYIEEPMTATTFSNMGKRSSREIITNEIIYYWMFTLGIAKECEQWHLNRLMTLIRVCSEKNSPKKKMSKNEIYAQNKALNESRRRLLHSKG